MHKGFLTSRTHCDNTTGRPSPTLIIHSAGSSCPSTWVKSIIRILLRVLFFSLFPLLGLTIFRGGPIKKKTSFHCDLKGGIHSLPPSVSPSLRLSLSHSLSLSLSLFLSFSLSLSLSSLSLLSLSLSLSLSSRSLSSLLFSSLLLSSLYLSISLSLFSFSSLLFLPSFLTTRHG